MKFSTIRLLRTLLLHGPSIKHSVNVILQNDKAESTQGSCCITLSTNILPIPDTQYNNLQIYDQIKPKL